MRSAPTRIRRQPGRRREILVCIVLAVSGALCFLAHAMLLPVH